LNPNAAAPALSLQLLHAARCVQAVEAGRSLTDALPQVPAALRPGVQALVFHGLRHLGLARALRLRLTDTPPPPVTSGLLHTALALLAAQDDHPATPRYDPHTVVDQAVQAMHTLRRAQSGLVNACLRRFLRERDALLPEVLADWEARYNHPAWWVKRLRRDHPQHWQAILAAAQHPASLVLRAHTPAMDRDGLLQHLAQAGAAARAVPVAQVEPEAPDTPDALVLDRPVGVEALPGYAQGWFAVQDVAAQMAAPLLLQDLTAQLQSAGHPAPAHGQPLRVLDACAAPGGKTAHLVALAHRLGLPVQVLALEVDPVRARRITDNLQRLRAAAEVRVADAAQTAAWWDGQPFDAILLDAPCTASGIVRRHPDVRWLRRESDVAALVDTQRSLLDALWPLLRPGGRMVYATCSVFKAEGAGQAAAFLARHSNARAAPAPGHLWPTGAAMADNPAREHDGFFYARLDKSPD
jgi:16S rRNA (cytosine967-C5)-methyltransferase